MEDKKEFEIKDINQEENAKASKVKKTIKSVIGLGLGTTLFYGSIMSGLAYAQEIQNLPFPQNMFCLLGVITVMGTGAAIKWKSFFGLDKTLSETKEENQNERKL